MKIFKILLFSVLFVILLAGCSMMPERGEITFEAPLNGAEFHDPSDAPVMVSISINSSFKKDKEARLYIDGIGPYSCWLNNTVTTFCNNVQIDEPGVHVIRAEVDKENGEIVFAHVSIDWTPYSPLDQSMVKIASYFGSNDPALGFNLVGFLISALVAIPLIKIGGKWGAIVAFFLALFGVLYWAPSGVSALLLQSIYGVVGGYFTIVIITLIVKNLHFFRVRRADGASLTYVGSGGDNGAKVISSAGQHGNQLLGQPSQQTRYSPRYQQHQLPHSEEYVDVEPGIIRETFPAKGFLGFIGRLLGRE